MRQITQAGSRDLTRAGSWDLTRAGSRDLTRLAGLFATGSQPGWRFAHTDLAGDYPDVLVHGVCCIQLYGIIHFFFLLLLL